MPNATVATTTSARSATNASWFGRRSASASPPGYGAAAEEVAEAGLPARGVDHREHLPEAIDARLDAVDQVRPVHGPDEERRIAQPELGDDVGAALGGRRGRVRGGGPVG